MLVNRWMKRLVPLMAMMMFVLTGCNVDIAAGAFNPKGPVASKQLELILISLGVMILVLLVVFVLFFLVVFRFRRRPGNDGIPEQIEGNHKLEATWTIIPIILLMVIAIPTVALTFDLEKEAHAYEAEDTLLIKVVAKQFWWEFSYPEQGIVTAQEAYIPVGEKVVFELTASDVQHSFWVPELGGKKDTNVGNKNINHIYLQAEEPGEYKGKCAELCGQGHALMDFKLIAVSQEEFDAWVADMLVPAEVTAELENGAELFGAKCLSCHAIEPGQLSMGPNLNGFADRRYLAGFLDNNAENLTKWIEDPLSVKPGVLMPGFKGDLTADEIQEIVKYLQSLN